MAVVVTDLRTTITEADTTTGFTGAGGTATSTFAEATACVQNSLNIATGQIYFTGTSVNLSNTLVYVYGFNNAIQENWDNANPPLGLHLGDGTNRISFRMAGSDRRVFNHADGPTEWQNLVLDGSQASAMNSAGLTTVRAGNFASLNLSAITQFGCDFTTLSKALAGGFNVAVDIMRWGNDGLQITGGTTSDRGMFLEVVEEDRSTDNLKGHGIIRELGTGLYGCQGPLNFGSSASALDSWFDDEGRVLSFENRNIGNDKYYIRVRGNSGSTNFFRLNACTITTAGPFVRCDFDGGNIDDFILTNNNFNLLSNAITFSSASDGLNHTVTGNTFNICGRIDPGVTEFRNNIISRSTNSEGAMLLDTDGTDNMSDLTFISGGTGHGILITSPGTYDFVNFFFSGYGANETTDAAVYNNSGGAVTINVSGGDNPTVRNGAGSTTTVLATVQITLTGLAPNTEVRVYIDDAGENGDEIAGVENSGTSFSFNAEVGEIINIIINSLFFLPADIWQFTVPNVNAVIPITQFPDRQYFNPP
jgi:hypothetical protein